MSGWLKLHRSLLEWEWYKDHNTRCVFIHCLLRANFEDCKWQGIVIPCGSFVTSIGNMAKEVGISPQNVRTSLGKLKSTSNLTIKTTNKYTVISVNNWDSYQDTNKQTNKQSTNNQQTTNNSIRNKERKEIKNKYNTLDLITTEVIGDIAKQYQVSFGSVAKELDSMKLYCQSNGKSYQDYRAALQNWVRRKVDEKKIPTVGVLKTSISELLEQKERQYGNQ